MKKVSDIIASFLASSPATAKDLFMVSGGGNMHIIDSIGREPGLRYICNHHEQGCAIGAEGFARVSNRIGVAVVTTGPGGTNAVTGVYGAWVDSIPILVISGQVKCETTIAAHPELHLRQLGDQEVNIVDIVRPITKYAVMITDRNDILFHLEKAVHEAVSGRPGPVWLDVPLDIQGALVEEAELRHFEAPEKSAGEIDIPAVAAALKAATRPVLIAGNGVRLSGGVEHLRAVIGKFNIPLLTAISGVDLVETDHPLFFGRPGILGERAANFILQNCDLLIVVGTRMNLRMVSYNWEYVARKATKIMVDIDPAELDKKTFRPDIRILSDAAAFLKKLLTLNPTDIPAPEKWLDYCRTVRNAYPVFNSETVNPEGYVSSYYFPVLLSRHLPPSATIVTGNGIAYTSTFQTFPVRKGDRLFANVGCASMGYDLPAAIGACVANERRETICITGDGSIQMNIQELQTIIHNRLPIKIFMYNNNGYLSIRITQTSFFNRHFVGESPSSGVTIPDMVALTSVYGFKTFRIRTNREAEELLPAILQETGPVFCEVMLDPEEPIGPKVASYRKEDGTMVSKPLEDLYPFLPRDEFLSNMIIDPIPE